MLLRLGEVSGCQVLAPKSPIYKKLFRHCMICHNEQKEKRNPDLAPFTCDTLKGGQAIVQNADLSFTGRNAL